MGIFVLNTVQSITTILLNFIWIVVGATILREFVKKEKSNIHKTKEKHRA